MADVILIGNGDGSFTDPLSDLAYYQRFQAIKSGTVKSIMIKGLTSNGNAKAAIYSDVAGSIGVVLAQAGSTPISLGVWNTVPIADVSIIIGNYYWLAVAPDALNVVARRSSTEVTTKYTSFPDYSVFTFSDAPGGRTTGRDIPFAGWGAEATTGCPRQTMFFKMMG